MKLDQFFKPRSIAVIGASVNPGKIGFQIFTKLLQSNQKIYPVNPQYPKLLNQTCYPSITAIPAPVDQAVIVIPAQFVSSVIDECLQKKVTSIVIISAGFSESGPSGSLLEGEIKAKLKNANVTVLGPNCLGYAYPSAKIDLTFAKASPPDGPIALLTQSGAIGSFLFDWAKDENLGFSHFVSLGNRIQLNENDLLEYLQTDPHTKVIGLYLESFANAETFLKIASRVSQKKPIIVLFGGLTASGKQAAMSHTAALSPEKAVIATVFRQSGCLQVKSLEEFTNLLEIFSLEPPLNDNDLAIVTNAGGPAILATDTASQVKLHVGKPLDVFGDALAEQFSNAFKTVIKDHVQDAFLIIITPQTSTELEATAKSIVSQFKHIKKPIVVSLLGAQMTEAAEKILKDKHIATISFPQSAVKYLSRLYNYWSNRQNIGTYPVRQTKKNVSKKISLSSGQLSWSEMSKLAKLYKIPLVKTIAAKSDNLNKLIKELGFPLVFKTDPTEAIHRTGNQAIYLNLKSLLAVRSAYKKISQHFQQILAQPQIQAGHELFIGLKRTPGYPILLTLGSGGIYTELYQDITHLFLPINQKSITYALKATKLGQILFGFRTNQPFAVKPVISLIENLACLIEAYPQIQTIDVNPALVTEHQVVIVDIKITTSPLSEPLAS